VTVTNDLREASPPVPRELQDDYLDDFDLANDLPSLDDLLMN
jgi:hypothetical protein